MPALSKIKKLFSIKSTEMRIAEKSLTEINALEEKTIALTNEQLKGKTEEFKNRLAKGETLESIREEAFAVAREATKRVLYKRLYDVQILGGILLDLGSVAEMKTGEGKTITSVPPVYLNALLGKGVIVSTVNEYLTVRDATELGEVYNFLGLTVGINKAQMDSDLKREAYAADITYSVHSELGFDYLRDNMVETFEEKVQRELYFCLVDEVDSILIDEAKTPLIISGGNTEETHIYFSADQFVRSLRQNDYVIDEETKAISLTHSGIEKANSFFGLKSLYDIENSELVHRISNALRAHKIMKNNYEYIVREEKIELVDAFTGRIMDGRSYSEGLQQAIQAKEMVEIEPETKTLATITYQNFFRMFSKLCGMTGTGKTEEQEFIDIYNMRVNVVPTNLPVARVDEPDEIFASSHSKWKAVVEKIKELYSKKQPVLVGTAQIEDSEILHELLQKNGIPHQVLNAKQNAAEAEIIANAGKIGTVTIATNMAGRGTDIKISQEVLDLGGLFVLGTDKAEARRIDNQLKGRSGRQGDIGVSKFYISIEDMLIRRFSNFDTFKSIYKDAGDAPITSKSLNLTFNSAQKKIEGFNYDSRKNVLNYDDVIRQQRDLIYSQRDLILLSQETDFIGKRMIISTAKSIVNNREFHLKNGVFDYEGLANFLNDTIISVVPLHFDIEEMKKIHEIDLLNYISEKLVETYEIWCENIIKAFGAEYLNNMIRRNIISILDKKWQNHINVMDKLRSNINLVQYAQKNPFQIYTDEGTQKFEAMISDIAFDVTLSIFRNPLGRTSLITDEIKIDPVYEQIIQNINFDPNMPIHQQEKQILEIFNSIKNRIQELNKVKKTEENESNLINNSNNQEKESIKTNEVNKENEKDILEEKPEFITEPIKSQISSQEKTT